MQMECLLALEATESGLRELGRKIDEGWEKIVGPLPATNVQRPCFPTCISLTDSSLSMLRLPASHDFATRKQLDAAAGATVRFEDTG